MNKALARFHACTVAEAFNDPAAYNFYFVQEPRPGQTDLRLVKSVKPLPDGSYRIVAGAGNQQFDVAADQLLYYPPED